MNILSLNKKSAMNSKNVKIALYEHFSCIKICSCNYELQCGEYICALTFHVIFRDFMQFSFVVQCTVLVCEPFNS